MSELGFSGQEDHFGLAAANLVLHSSSLSPATSGVEVAENEKGDTIAQGIYADGAGSVAECVYHVIDGTFNLNTISLGPDGNDVIVEVSAETSNGEWPTVTVSGNIGATGTPGGAPDGSNFACPSVAIVGKKIAQAMGCSGGANIQSSSVSASGEIHFVLADATTVGAVGFTGAEVSGEINCLFKDAAPTITWAAPFVVTQPLTSEGEITGWSSGSSSAQGVLTASV